MDDAEDCANDALIDAATRYDPAKASDDRAWVLGCVEIAVQRKRRAQGHAPVAVADLAAVERQAERKAYHGHVLNPAGPAPGGRHKMQRLSASEQDRVVALVADAVALHDAFLPLARAFVKRINAPTRGDDSELDVEWAKQLPTLRRILGPDWCVWYGAEIADGDPELAEWQASKVKHPALAIDRASDGRLRLVQRLLPDRLWIPDPNYPPDGKRPTCPPGHHPLSLLIEPPEFLGAFDGLRHRKGSGWARGSGRPRDGAPLVAAYVAAAAAELLYRRQLAALPETQEQEAAEAAFMAEEDRRNAAGIATDTEWGRARSRKIDAGRALEAASKRLVRPATALIVEMAARGAVQAGRASKLEVTKAVRREVMRDGKKPVPSPFPMIRMSMKLTCEGCPTPCAGPSPKCRGRVAGVTSQVTMPQGRRDRSGRPAAATVKPTPVLRLLATMPHAFRETLDALIRYRLER